MSAPAANVTAVKANVKIAPGAVVCSECELKGDVTIGAKTVIHPKARIIAESGPIIIGEGNLIEEQSQIVNQIGTDDEPPADGDSQQVMTIGNYNVFEVGSESHCMKMGDLNILEAKSHVGRNTVLTTGCIVGAACRLTSEEVIAENTVVYGGDCRRRRAMDKQPPQTLQIDYLSKVLPNYHHLKKSAKKPAA